MHSRVAFPRSLLDKMLNLPFSISKAAFNNTDKMKVCVHLTRFLFQVHFLILFFEDRKKEITSFFSISPLKYLVFHACCFNCYF